MSIMNYYKYFTDFLTVWLQFIFYILKIFDTLLTKHFSTIYNSNTGGVLWKTLTKIYEPIIFIISEVSPVQTVPISTPPFRRQCIVTRIFMNFLS